MELIDRDEAIKRLGDAHFKNYGNAIMVIRETLPVDAIPVEWLYDLAEKKEEEKDIKLSAMIKGVVALYKMEKRKQYFPKGFFSKERPLAKGEEDGSD